MVGILIIAHGQLGETFIQCASHVLAAQPPALSALGFTEKDDPEALLARAREQARQLDSGNGVLVLTDILGATPANIATRLIIPGRLEVVTGISLPMLLRSITYRDKPLVTLVRKAISGGTEGVVHIRTEGIHAAG